MCCFKLLECFTALPNAQLRFALVQALQDDASLADVHAGDVSTSVASSLHWKSILYAVADLQVFTRMNNIDDGRWSDLFQVLDECPCVSPVCVWRVDALGGEVIQLLEVSVHHDLFSAKSEARISSNFFRQIFQRFWTQNSSISFHNGRRRW